MYMNKSIYSREIHIYIYIYLYIYIYIIFIHTSICMYMNKFIYSSCIKYIQYNFFLTNRLAHLITFRRGWQRRRQLGKLKCSDSRSGVHPLWLLYTRVFPSLPTLIVSLILCTSFACMPPDIGASECLFIQCRPFTALMQRRCVFCECMFIRYT